MILWVDCPSIARIASVIACWPARARDTASYAPDTATRCGSMIAALDAKWRAEDSLIRFHAFPNPWKISPSPFCFRLKTHCRLAGASVLTVPTLPFRAAPIIKAP
jgi:hypothetical protein